jgi:hypothetical protein
MTALNGFFGIALTVLVVPLYGTGCKSVPVPPAPGERPAEIILPPTLTAGNLDKIRRDLQPFRHGPRHSRTRVAKCLGCLVEVEIQSIGLTTDIRPINGPAKFRIIGRLKNTDSRDAEALYSLKPDGEYLMWVAPAGLNKRQTSRTIWGLLELPRGSTGAIRAETIGYVEVCHHPPKPRPWISDTDFKHCEDPHASQPPVNGELAENPLTFFASSGGSSSRLSYARPGWFDSRPGWFDCGGVCCTGTSVN